MNPSTLTNFVYLFRAGEGQWMDTILYIFGLTVTALILLAAHWFPWPRKIHRLEAYCIGIGAILAGQAVWLCCKGEWRLWLALTAFSVAAGTVVGGAYAVDALLKYRVRRMLNGRDELEG